MASETGKGAMEGAATGAAAGPWGALIGAAVGAIGGLMKGKARKKEEKRMKENQARMRALATPAHLQEVIAHMTPLMRNIVESGLGPQFKMEIDKNLAQHGATGTGAGEAIRSAAQAVPSLMTAEKAFDASTAQVGRELNTEATAAGLEPPVAENPLMQALLGGARGYMSGGGTFNFGKGKGGAEGTIAKTGPSDNPADPYSPTRGKM